MLLENLLDACDDELCWRHLLKAVLEVPCLSHVSQHRPLTTVPFARPGGGYSQGTTCSAVTLYISMISLSANPPPMKIAFGTLGSGLFMLEPRPDTGIVGSPASSGTNSDLPTGALLMTWTTDQC